jgi:hypothetical protein
MYPIMCEGPGNAVEGNAEEKCSQNGEKKFSFYRSALW